MTTNGADDRRRSTEGPGLDEGRADEADRSPADLRLLLPALAAWAAVAVLLGRGPQPPAATAATAALAGVVFWARHRHDVASSPSARHRPDGPAAQRARLLAVTTSRATASLRDPARPRTRPRSGDVLPGGGRAHQGIGSTSIGGWRAGVALGLILASALLLRVTGTEVEARRGPMAGLAAERAVVTLQGRVTAQPRRLRQGETGPPRVAVALRVDRVVARGLATEVATPVLLLGGPEWRAVGWRDVVEVTGRLEPAEPGDQVRAVLAARSGPSIRAGPEAAVAVANRVRAAMRDVVAPLPPDARGLVPAMIIGDRDAVPEDLADAMVATGMSHLTAVSGTNCALVVAAVVWTAGWLGVRRRARPILGGAVLAAFVLVARPDPSVIRAAVMGAIGLIGLWRSRRGVGMPALAGAILLLLAIDPWLARSYGFALSVLATLGLLILARPWSRALRRVLRLPAAVADAVAIPSAAQLACAPVIVLLQGEISVVGILTNVVVAPAVAPATVLGAVTAGLCVPWAGAATLVAWAASLPVAWVAWVARAGAETPVRAIPWPDHPLAAAGLAVLVIAGVCCAVPLCRRARRRPAAVVLVVLLAAAAVVPWSVVRSRTGFPGGQSPALTMCDVGQGDAFVLRSGPGRAVVVDVGPEPDAVDRCLDALGVRVVDALVLTHFDQDHVGGLTGVDRGRTVGDVVVSAASMADARPAVNAWLRGHDRPLHQTVEGDRMGWGDISVIVRGPRAGGRTLSANAGSLVLDVVVDGPAENDRIRALLLADADEDAGAVVRSALRADPEAPSFSPRSNEDAHPPFDVVKVAHHGSAHHDARLLDVVRAPVALISVGADNDYGHPAATLLRHVQAAGSVVYRTDRDGAVAIRKQSGRILVVREKTP